MTTHPSPITLERLSVGELSGTERTLAAEHAEGCSACRAFLEELKSAQTARLASVPPDEFIARVAERRDREANLEARRQRRWALGGTATAAIAAALFLLIPRPGPQVHLKGAGVTIHRNRGGSVEVLTGDDTIRAGDALRVVITQAQAGPVGAWVVDANGRVDALLASAAQPLPAGEYALPGSAVVESPCVNSWLVVVFGDAANENTAETLHMAIADGVPQGDSWFPKAAQVRKLRCE
jgi:hypothetical protein